MKRALLAGCAAVAVLAGMGSAARAVDQDAIDKAIDRGVEFLRGDGALTGGDRSMQPTGATALVGLTLLECGAAADDPAVRRAVEVVRPAAVTTTQTYTLALSILFLDRLGDPADEPLIQSMTVRLLAGQNSTGGWSYTCPNVAESEVRRLTSAVHDAPKPDKGPDGKPVKPTVKGLPREIQDQLVRIDPAPVEDALQRTGDNSNTQFATLALWVARRHGLPVEKALARVEQRFRVTQDLDGGWAYTPAFDESGRLLVRSSATMTCAGVLGLEVGHGVAAEAAQEKGKAAPNLAADGALKKALAALGTAVGAPPRAGRAQWWAASRTTSSGRWSAWPSSSTWTRSAATTGTPGVRRSSWPTRGRTVPGTANTRPWWTPPSRCCF